MLNGPLGLVVLGVSGVVAIGTMGATIHLFWQIGREIPRLLSTLRFYPQPIVPGGEEPLMVARVATDIVLMLSVLASAGAILAAASELSEIGAQLRDLAARAASLQRKIGDATLLLRETARLSDAAAPWPPR